MLLYNEDNLDILDQSFDIRTGLEPEYNKYLAYNYDSYWAVEAIKQDLKEYNYYAN